MQIEYRRGDLIAAEETVLVHGCNAQGRFASGVAGVIREHLPFAYQAYQSYFENVGQPSLGTVIWAFNVGRPTERSRIVGNMITQQFYGRDGRRYVDYNAIATAMQEVNQFVLDVASKTIHLQALEPITHVAMPLIGAGLGGGSWPVIADIIERAALDFTPVVYTLDGRIPT